MMDVNGTILALHGEDFVEVITFVEVRLNILSFFMAPFHYVYHHHPVYFNLFLQESAFIVMDSASGLVSDEFRKCINKLCTCIFFLSFLSFSQDVVHG